MGFTGLLNEELGSLVRKQKDLLTTLVIWVVISLALQSVQMD
jgi:hypothetical protein